MLLQSPPTPAVQSQCSVSGRNSTTLLLPSRPQTRDTSPSPARGNAKRQQKIFPGTDSAPHATKDKESACGCAGIYSAHAALELYTEFLMLTTSWINWRVRSFYGADFYQLPRNKRSVTLIQQAWQVPASYSLATQRSRRFAPMKLCAGSYQRHKQRLTNALQPGHHYTIAERFRGFLPVVVDVETGGFNAQTDALLEIAATIVEVDDDGLLTTGELRSTHVIPFKMPISTQNHSKSRALQTPTTRCALRARERCFRIHLQAHSGGGTQPSLHPRHFGRHNASFDLSFINAAVARTGIKKNPTPPL